MSCGGLVMYHSNNSGPYPSYLSSPPVGTATSSASNNLIAASHEEQNYNSSVPLALASTTPNPSNGNDGYNEKVDKYLKPDPCASPAVPSASASPINQTSNPPPQPPPPSHHQIQSLDYSAATAASPNRNNTQQHPNPLLPPQIHLGHHYSSEMDRGVSGAGAAYPMGGAPMGHRGGGGGSIDENGGYVPVIGAPPALQRLPPSCNDHTSVTSRHHTPTSVNNESSPSDMSKGDDMSGSGGTARGGEAPEGSATYITERCLLVTYFTGDISQVVDEHFSRALSANSQSSDSHHKDSSSTSSIPLSQRNLPASFWNSDYHYSSSAALSSQLAAAGHAALAAGHADIYDPYTNSALLQASNDPWQNYMAAAASGSAYSAAHRAAGMHDMYSARLNQQYSSLFLQSSAAAVRQGRKDSWGGGGHGAAIDGYGSTHPHYNAMTGLEGTMQGSSKDLYWF
ncbi:hypothetical protein TCAL_09229 [Tigriopus californicus]|uniref:Uncharacterized protein n=1 Tax=Tigriopus californicus TaxID=6832 RepID=A0A553PEZ1_TIGCA|nr:fidgetin-like [Tigriopus californicus]TRY76239.1 hypothetical protein TCAL_09229 [Tigriopus californicus]|eukprot:TCALIF_09229-PA protein Name:"Similar to Vgll2 Transcription cofactor vestigial-like protein 2 (Mus musculus)" AED:0.00 eAED:0.00 QI:327/1/1/1/0.5/0.6/5/163/454